jgi:hypothetical protein
MNIWTLCGTAAAVGAAVAVAAGLTPASASTNCTVNGYAVDARTHAPVANAIVWYLPADRAGPRVSTRSDRNGFYTFVSVPPGTYLLSAQTDRPALLYQPCPPDADVSSGEITRVNFSMWPIPRVVSMIRVCPPPVVYRPLSTSDVSEFDAASNRLH